MITEKFTFQFTQDYSVKNINVASSNLPLFSISIRKNIFESVWKAAFIISVFS